MYVPAGNVRGVGCAFPSCPSRLSCPTLFTARGAPPPLATGLGPPVPSCLSCPSLFTARGAPPPLARAAALEDALSSRGPLALVVVLLLPTARKRDRFIAYGFLTSGRASWRRLVGGVPTLVEIGRASCRESVESSVVAV